ncbi:MAG: TetR/AcrR family transcriptional regulator [Terriglobales bacterium]
MLKQAGFNDLSIEAIAARAEVGKATVYRWWPNKAALVIDAFVSVVGEELRFRSAGSAKNALHEQMRRWTEVFRSPLGRIVATVIGAGQSEPEILQAFREHWVEPRRREARQMLKKGMENGEIRNDLDPDIILDILYGPLYFRLLVQNAVLTSEFVESLLSVITPGLMRN